MKSHIIGSNNTAPSVSAVNYGIPSLAGATSWSTTEAARRNVVPHAMTIDQLRVTVTTAPGAAASGKKFNFTLMVNGVASALSCDILETATSGQDVVNSVALNAGDVISIRTTPTGTPAAPGISYWNMRQNAADLFGMTTSSTSGAAGTFYMPIQGNIPSLRSTVALGNTIVPTAGTLKNLRFWARAALPAGTSMQATLFKNGVATAVTATIAAGSSTASDTTNSESVVAGDLVCWRIVVTGSISAAGLSVGCSFDPTVDGESFITYSGSGGSGPSTSATNYQTLNEMNDAFNATESNRYTRLPATTLRALYVETSVSPGASPKAYTFTVRKEIADTAATLTINDASTAIGSTRRGQITGLSIAVADDNRMSMKTVPVSAPLGLFAKYSILTYLDPAGAGGDQIISASSVTSASTLGTPTVSAGAVTLAVVSLVSTLALGSPAVSPGPVSIAATGIASSSSIGAPTLSSAYTLNPAALESSASLGSPTLPAGGATIGATGISSTSSIGDPTVSSAYALAPAGLDSSVSLGSPTLAPGEVSASPAGMSSTAQIGLPTLSPGAVSTSPSGLPSSAAVGSPSVQAGAVTASPAGIDSAATIGTPSLTSVVTIAVSSLDSTSSIGSPTVSAAGSNGISSSGIASTAVLGTPTLSPGAVAISAGGLDASSSLGVPTVSAGTVVIAPAGISSGLTLGAPTIEPATVTLQPAGIASSVAYGTPVFASGDGGIPEKLLVDLVESESAVELLQASCAVDLLPAPALAADLNTSPLVVDLEPNVLSADLKANTITLDL